MIQDIPDKDKVVFTEPDESGMFSLMFFAFSTLVTLKGYVSRANTDQSLVGAKTSDQNEEITVKAVAQEVVDLCRRFEWLLSRTLEGSDLAKLNSSAGEVVELQEDTWRALRLGVEYSSKSRGHFDITMGSVTRLWDFNKKIVPQKSDLLDALKHVNWQNIILFDSNAAQNSEGARTHYFAQLST